MIILQEQLRRIKRNQERERLLGRLPPDNNPSTPSSSERSSTTSSKFNFYLF